MIQRPCRHRTGGPDPISTSVETYPAGQWSVRLALPTTPPHSVELVNRMVLTMTKEASIVIAGCSSLSIDDTECMPGLQKPDLDRVQPCRTEAATVSVAA